MHDDIWFFADDPSKWLDVFRRIGVTILDVTSEVLAKVSPARSYQGLFRIGGSLVFRTEDVWRRCNQFIETAEFLIRVSPSHSYNTGRAGEWVVLKKCVRCMQ
jgi:hypothetical protein